MIDIREVTIAELGLETRIFNKLDRAGILTLGDLAAAAEVAGFTPRMRRDVLAAVSKLRRDVRPRERKKGDPTPEEIKRRAAAIRATWPESRWGERAAPYVIPRGVDTTTVCASLAADRR